MRVFALVAWIVRGVGSFYMDDPDNERAQEQDDKYREL